MNSGQPFSSLRTVLIFLLVVATPVLTLLAVSRVASSQQQDPNPGNPSPQGDAARERKIGIGIPKHLPLKFEIRNLNSDRWVYDLEIEVTNTSTKPIYYLDFFMSMPGYKSKNTGNKLGFWFRYGRIQLVDFAESLVPGDIPLAPGEKHTFKIQESNAKGWEEASKREGRPEPKVFNLQFQGLNFGDGTGFVTTAGEPVNIHKKVGIDPGRRDGIRVNPWNPSKNPREMLVLLKTLPLECDISMSVCFSTLVLVGGVTPDYGDQSRCRQEAHDPIGSNQPLL